MCGPGNQTRLDALYDGNQGWPGGGDDERFRIRRGDVQGKRDRRHSGKLSESVPESRFCSFCDAWDVETFRVHERELDLESKETPTALESLC